jgi:hypothetical protein
MYEHEEMTSINEMKSKSCVNIEDGVDRVERLDLDDGRGDEACRGAPRQAMASCSKLWLAMACCS